jgi:hypothetical protein
MWGYAEFVVLPQQQKEAIATGRPRGNLSDLYPRWLGARELLLHGRDPYSAEVNPRHPGGLLWTFARSFPPERSHRSRKASPTQSMSYLFSPPR